MSVPDAREVLTASAHKSALAQDLSPGIDYLIGCEVCIAAGKKLTMKWHTMLAWLTLSACLHSPMFPSCLLV